MIWFWFFIVPISVVIFAFIITNIVDYVDERKRNYNFEQYDKKQNLIFSYIIDRKIINNFKKIYPQLSQEQIIKVENNLKCYFSCLLNEILRIRLDLNISKKEQEKILLVMPSKVVDDLWLCFVQCNETYREFCLQAFGYVLPHRPITHVESIPEEQLEINPLLLKTLYCVQHQETTKTQKSYNEVKNGLPSLFSIDQEFGIENGFYYDLKELLRFERALKEQSKYVSY